MGDASQPEHTPPEGGRLARAGRRLSVKDADNALDQAGTCRFGLLPEGDGAYVEDDGGGIEGDDLRVAHLFSIARPMVSTKVRRMPTRGALGNGLRVVAAPFWPPGAPSRSHRRAVAAPGTAGRRDDDAGAPRRVDGKGTRSSLAPARPCWATPGHARLGEDRRRTRGGGPLRREVVAVVVRRGRVLGAAAGRGPSNRARGRGGAGGLRRSHGRRSGRQLPGQGVREPQPRRSRPPAEARASIRQEGQPRPARRRRPTGSLHGVRQEPGAFKVARPTGAWGRRARTSEAWRTPPTNPP